MTDIKRIWQQSVGENRQAILSLLERMEEEELTEEELGAIETEIRGRLSAMRRERDGAIGQLAQESNLIDELETRYKELRRVKRKRFHIVPPAPTNAQIDRAERKLSHFARGKSFYKIFWMFFIGSIVGVFAERIWSVVRYGVYEPRVGSIYGPFNPVYGLGAAVLTLALYNFRNRGKLLSIAGGMIVGSVVEYICSYVQEKVFGSASWDYSNRPFNLNGRICLLYSIYWGLFALVWIKELYPRFAYLILKIPNKIGKPLTCALAVFMTVNMLMTGLCVLRWSERRAGEGPSNPLEGYFDRYYPNEKMEKIFSNLEFVDQRDARRARDEQLREPQDAQGRL